MHCQPRLTCTFNTRATDGGAGGQARACPEPTPQVKLAPLILERVPTSPYLDRDRAGRGRASTRASLDPPPPVSAGTSPSAAPGRWAVDRPARARVPVRHRPTTPLPGHALPVPLAGVASLLRSGSTVELCIHPPPLGMFMLQFPLVSMVLVQCKVGSGTNRR